MATEKTFDKADLLRYFLETDGDALVGKFTVIHPPTPQQLAFDQEATKGETTRYPVVAETAGLHCERYGFSVVVQSVILPDGGHQYLPKHHPLRVLTNERRVTLRYGGTSSQLVRWAVDLAEEWRGEVGYAVPKLAIDRTAGAKDGIVEDWGSGTLRLVPGPTPIPEPEPEPEPATPAAAEPEVDVDDPDHAPTGTTIDDVFAEHTDDTGDESEGPQ